MFWHHLLLELFLLFLSAISGFFWHRAEDKLENCRKSNEELLKRMDVWRNLAVERGLAIVKIKESIKKL